MAGCRSITDQEQVRILEVLKTPRDKMLFLVGLKTGFRISELLSLKIQDVYQADQVVTRIKVCKRNMKGKIQGREVPLHAQAVEAIKAYIATLGATINPNQPLFLSRNGVDESISRHGAHKLLKQAYKAAGVTGFLATHTMRKTFAGKVYKALKNDLFLTQKALGHKSVLSTINYLEVDQDLIDAVVLAG